VLAADAGYARFHGANNGPAASCDKEKALAYKSADRTGKSRILNELVELTGWHRDYARTASEGLNMAPEDIKAALEAVYLLIQILNQLAPTMRAVHKSLRTRRNLRKSGDMQEANGAFYRLSRAY
jgi:hypothetical protein